MKNEIVFYPMSEIPVHDESDTSFSKTVIVYDDKLNFSDMGYYDFERGEWSCFGEVWFLLKCWCYIPHVTDCENISRWETIKSKRIKK